MYEKHGTKWLAATSQTRAHAHAFLLCTELCTEMIGQTRHSVRTARKWWNKHVVCGMTRPNYVDCCVDFRFPLAFSLHSTLHSVRSIFHASLFVFDPSFMCRFSPLAEKGIFSIQSRTTYATKQCKRSNSVLTQSFGTNITTSIRGRCLFRMGRIFSILSCTTYETKQHKGSNFPLTRVCVGVVCFGRMRFVMKEGMIDFADVSFAFALQTHTREDIFNTEMHYIRNNATKGIEFSFDTVFEQI